MLINELIPSNTMARRDKQMDLIWSEIKQNKEAQKAIFSSARALMSQIEKIESAADKVPGCCNCGIQGPSLRDGFCAMCD
mgnify:CR=1 FL=1